MFINDKYINESQITKITYIISYNKDFEGDIYEFSKFHLALVNDNFIRLYLLKEGIFKMTDELSRFDATDEYYHQKALLKRAHKIDKRIKNRSGHIKVLIQLSSGSVEETIINKFEDKYILTEKFIDISKPYKKYEEIKIGESFEPSEINIEYVYNKIFKKASIKYKEDKIMI